MGGNGASSKTSKMKLNPYAKAFVNKKGKFNAPDYINWINRKHAEFQKMNPEVRHSYLDNKKLGIQSGYDPETNKKFIKFINK